MKIFQIIAWTITIILIIAAIVLLIANHRLLDVILAQHVKL